MPASRVEPASQIGEPWKGVLLTRSSSFVGQATADGVLDLVEFSDQAQGLGSDRRGVGLVDIEKLAPAWAQRATSVIAVRLPGLSA